MISRAFATVKRATFNMPFTIVIGLSLGGLLVPLGTSLYDWQADRYDGAFPVVEMHGKLLSHGDNEAVIALGGRKLRDCSYIRIQAYSVGADGNMSDTFIARTDIPEHGGARPIGEFQIGTWRVWPLPNSRGITVYINHLCGSRIVLTKVADIPFDNNWKGK